MRYENIVNILNVHSFNIIYIYHYRDTTLCTEELVYVVWTQCVHLLLLTKLIIQAFWLVKWWLTDLTNILIGSWNIKLPYNFLLYDTSICWSHHSRRLRLFPFSVNKLYASILFNYLIKFSYSRSTPDPTFVLHKFGIILRMCGLIILLYLLHYLSSEQTKAPNGCLCKDREI